MNYRVYGHNRRGYKLIVKTDNLDIVTENLDEKNYDRHLIIADNGEYEVPYALLMQPSDYAKFKAKSKRKVLTREDMKNIPKRISK